MKIRKFQKLLTYISIDFADIWRHREINATYVRIISQRRLYRLIKVFEIGVLEVEVTLIGGSMHLRSVDIHRRNDMLWMELALYLIVILRLI